MQTKDKAFGAGVIPFLRNPDRVVLFLRTKGYPAHLNRKEPLPYANMPDIIGGHMKKLCMLADLIHKGLPSG